MEAAMHRPTPWILKAAGAMFVVVLAALLPVGPASATELGGLPALTPSAPQLSIAVDNGRTSTTAGDRLVYTITVRNLGAVDVAGLEVTQTVPPGLEFESADAAGTVDVGKIDWAVDLKAAAAVTVTSTMTVTDTPAELLRLATVACASTSGGPPIVCASHSDQLPAGAAAEAERAASASAAGHVRWYVISGVVVLVAGLGVLVIRRRGKASRS